MVLLLFLQYRVLSI